MAEGALLGHLGVAASEPGRSELTGLAGWVVSVVDALGAVGVGLLVALENLFPPIPSEVVLPVAGYVASYGGMGLVPAIVAATVGSLLGALVLYALGRTLGPARVRWLADRLPLVEGEDVDRAEEWFARHGRSSVLLGRCVPVVRSLVSVPAGVERMPLPQFCLYTVIGSGAWNTIFIVAGYQLGTRWEDIGRYSDLLNYAVYAILALLVLRFVVTRLRRKAHRR